MQRLGQRPMCFAGSDLRPPTSLLSVVFPITGDTALWYVALWPISLLRVMSVHPRSTRRPRPLTFTPRAEHRIATEAEGEAAARAEQATG